AMAPYDAYAHRHVRDQRPGRRLDVGHRRRGPGQGGRSRPRGVDPARVEPVMFVSEVSRVSPRPDRLGRLDRPGDLVAAAIIQTSPPPVRSGSCELKASDLRQARVKFDQRTRWPKGFNPDQIHEPTPSS